LDGKIYGVPCNSSDVLVVDPTTNTVYKESGFPAGGFKFAGGVLLPDRRIFALPFVGPTLTSYNAVAVLNGGPPNLNPWMLKPQFNKM
jgi:hypothetical protein